MFTVCTLWPGWWRYILCCITMCTVCTLWPGWMKVLCCIAACIDFMLLTQNLLVIRAETKIIACLWVNAMYHRVLIFIESRTAVYVCRCEVLSRVWCKHFLPPPTEYTEGWPWSNFESQVKKEPPPSLVSTALSTESQPARPTGGKHHLSMYVFS